MEDTEIKEVEKKEEVVVIDYDKINAHISTEVENKVGKFIKSFIENNRESKDVADITPTETAEERELREWKI